MRHTVAYPWKLLALGAVLAGLLGWPTAGAAQLVTGTTQTLTNTTQTLTSSTTGTTQTATGHAEAVRATVLGLLGGTTTVLASTGTLGGSNDARQASQTTGSVPSLLAAETLHATTIGWPDQAASEASLAGLALSVAGTSIGADFVMSRALAVAGAAGPGTVSIDGLSVNGLPITVTGVPNQTISIPGGQVVINEQQTSPGSTVVNALHVIVTGIADVVIGSATAGVQ